MGRRGGRRRGRKPTATATAGDARHCHATTVRDNAPVGTRTTSNGGRRRRVVVGVQNTANGGRLGVAEGSVAKKRTHAEGVLDAIRSATAVTPTEAPPPTEVPITKPLCPATRVPSTAVITDPKSATCEENK